jgi:hypothetical protein
MERKFRVLRIIGTLWKVLAWIALVVGTLSALGVFLVGVLGSGGVVWRYLGQDPGVMPAALGLVSGIAGGIVGLIAAIIYFLILYAVGELVFLLLAIEENTRLTVDWMQYWAGSGPQAELSQTPSPTAPSAEEALTASPSANSEV